MKKLLLVILALLAVGATAYVLNERRKTTAGANTHRSLDTFPEVATKPAATSTSDVA